MSGEVVVSMPEMRSDLPILEFADLAGFDDWLASNGRAVRGIWVKLARKGTDRTSVSKADAVDAALCHGWIDGQQDRYDEANWLTRFTPRRRGSRWSEINRTRAIELVSEGRMMPTGMAEIEAARADGRLEAAYAPARTAQIPPDLQAALDGSADAATAFTSLGRSDRYAILYQLSSLRTAATRQRKLAEFIATLGTFGKHDTGQRSISAATGLPAKQQGKTSQSTSREQR